MFSNFIDVPEAQPNAPQSAQPFQLSPKLNSKVSLWLGDITLLAIDVIVNSIHGNETLPHYDYSISGHQYTKFLTVADCIHKTGGRSLVEELLGKDGFPHVTTITKGHQLPAKCPVLCCLPPTN